MRTYLDKKEYDKIKPKKWCGTTLGGYPFCCRTHTSIIMILLALSMILIGMGIGASIG